MGIILRGIPTLLRLLMEPNMGEQLPLCEPGQSVFFVFPIVIDPVRKSQDHILDHLLTGDRTHDAARAHPVTVHTHPGDGYTAAGEHQPVRDGVVFSILSHGITQILEQIPVVHLAVGATEEITRRKVLPPAGLFAGKNGDGRLPQGSGIGSPS